VGIAHREGSLAVATVAFGGSSTTCLTPDIGLELLDDAHSTTEETWGESERESLQRLATDR